jgi:hypothetical protein
MSVICCQRLYASGAAARALFTGTRLLVGALVMLLYSVQTNKQSLEQISPSFVETAS